MRTHLKCVQLVPRELGLLFVKTKRRDERHACACFTQLASALGSAPLGHPRVGRRSDGLRITSLCTYTLDIKLKYVDDECLPDKSPLISKIDLPLLRRLQKLTREASLQTSNLASAV